MQLVFIHGAAAVGKLTVAKELAKRTGLRLFHNHLTVDLVSAIFDFGSEAFIKLREEIWLRVFREAALENVSLIFTFAPERTVRQGFIQAALDTVEAAGGKVIFVQLTCAPDEITRRIASPSRSEFGKLNSLELYQQLQAAGAFHYPALPAAGLSLDTTHRDPQETARLIAEKLSVGESSK
ncbi:MAG: AAA family ATPase [Acidobacteria bacterium]|nr:AAA family ATPase [Acidobacteriota bacterium]